MDRSRRTRATDVAWREVAATGTFPLIFATGHLLGGASQGVAAAAITGVLASATLGFLWRDRAAFDKVYKSLLRVPALAAAGLIALVLVSLAPGSAILAGTDGTVSTAGNTLTLDPSATAWELMKLMGLATAFTAAHVLVTNRRRFKLTLLAIVALNSVWCTWAMILLADQIGSGRLPRLTGPFISPNVAGALLAITLLLALALVSGRRTYASSPVRRPGFTSPTLIACGLLGVGILLTASRSTVVLVTGLLAVAAIVAFRRDRGTPPGVGWRGYGLLAAGGLAVVLALNVMAAILERLVVTGADAKDRWLIVTTFADAGRDAVTLGYGLGTVPGLSRSLITADNEAVFWNIRAVHNLAVQWWLETGTVGTALAVTVVGGLLWATWTGLDRDGRVRLMPLFLVSAFMLLQGLVDYAAQIYSVALTWAFVMGLGVSLASRPVEFWGTPKRSDRGQAPARVGSKGPAETPT